MKKEAVTPETMHRKKIRMMAAVAAVLVYLAPVNRLCAQSAHQRWLNLPDTVTTVASIQYSDPTVVRRFFMGNNYREAWITPVRLPVLNITALGLRVEELGGGKQTKSLKLVDQDGVEWALRSVDKDVRPAIPKIIRNKYTLAVVQDLVSAANPYAPLTIPPMADALGITVAHPRFFFVPDDTAFHQYRSLFANTVCMLEKRDVLKDVDTKATMNMLDDIMENHKAVLDQEAYLKARLLDMLVADWDRHYDQWKWAKMERSGADYYLPIPKDRDQAYFHSNGWLLRLIRIFGMKFTVGFTPETSNLVKLNSVAESLDQMLLNGLNRSDWQRIAATFQQQLSDETIREAVQKLPPSIYALNGASITQTLLARKQTLAGDVMDYYRHLAKKVTVYGTDKAERFYLRGNRDSLTLTITDKDKSEPFYQRTFFASETKKITLLGLDGDDEFACEKGLQTPIKIHIDGGKGKDQYRLDNTLDVKQKDSHQDAKAYLKEMREPLRVRE